MSAPFTRKLYNSTAWRECRKAYAKSVGNLCERCLSIGLYTPGREVHHKNHLTPQNINDPSVTLNWDNLELLCEQCHHEQHDNDGRKDKPGRRRWKLTHDGQVVLPVTQPPSVT